MHTTPTPQSLSMKLLIATTREARNIPWLLLDRGLGAKVDGTAAHILGAHFNTRPLTFWRLCTLLDITATQARTAGEHEVARMLEYTLPTTGHPDTTTPPPIGTAPGPRAGLYQAATRAAATNGQDIRHALEEVGIDHTTPHPDAPALALLRLATILDMTPDQVRHAGSPDIADLLAHPTL